MSRLCTNCGREIAEGSRYCAECGISAFGVHQVAAAPQDPLIGATIDGKYRLDSKIGVGGMAAVYRATRLLIGDLVAVKILKAEQFRDAQAPERFRREAQAAARLKHPNAVTIYDFGVSNEGLVYLVMELLEGKSLRAMVTEQGPFLPSAAAGIMSQVCAAVDEAHRHNVVHRDLKPDNIIATTTPRGLHIKVLDFGIARLRDVSGPGNLTQTGSVMGTPHYMSPEQCLGEELDGRSDIYSLGVVLYEMLAGVVPFNSPTSTAVLVQHVNTSPAPLRILNASVSPAVESVVLRALEKRREARPQTAGALAEELNAAVAGTTLLISSQSTGAINATGWGGLAVTANMPTPFATNAAPSGLRQPTGPIGPGRRVLPERKQSPRMLIAGGLAAGVVVIGALAWYFSSNAGTPETSVSIASVLPSGDGQAAPAVEPRPARTVPPPASPPAKAVPTAAKPPVRTDPPAAQADAPVSLAAPVPSSPPASRTVVATPTSARPPSTAGGGLTLRSQPGSAVSIDGTAVGTTSSEGILLIPGVAPGRHLLTVRRDGFRQEERTISFTGQSDVVQVEMVALPGSITVTADTEGAALQIDGGRVYPGQISNMELPAGHHRVTATKIGFKPAIAEVDVRPGEALRVSVSLDPAVDDVLALADKDYQAGRFDKAAAGARLVLANAPQQPRANLLLGEISYKLKKFPDSITYLARALDLGEKVVLPVKHHHSVFPNDALCSGFVTLTRSTLAFHSTTLGGHDFEVPSNKILEIKDEPQKAARVNVKLTTMNGAKEEKKDYNFHNAAASLHPSESGSKIVVVGCPGCDDSMSVLYELLARIRSK